jgi:TolB-like protein/Tfp pilus assembly protein PilF
MARPTEVTIPGQMLSFLEELKRRNVFRVGLAYLVGAWLLIQVVDILLDNIGAPAWVLQTLFVGLGVGFFITLFFAWAFEMTPDGVKREKDVDRSQSITPNTGKKLNNATLVLMAIAIAYLLFDKFSDEAPETVSSAQTEVVGTSSEDKPDQGPVTETPRQSIAVLPFDNRSRNVDDEYFTEGIHDDLLTNLARISSLKVISRTSVTQYKNTEKTIPMIAKELGVATVMEGAVQRSGNTVRINVQLIDAKTDEHLWAEIFDRELTAENLFVIQSEISEKIAAALEATLSPEEEQRINEFPTQNLEAYNAYLRGRQLLPQRNSKDLGLAMESFERAVELDPDFALAWVGIAESANLLGAHGTLNPDEKIRIMEVAVKRALEINPNLGEAYTSKGSLLDDLNQTAQAEAAYKRAIELSPNYATTYHWYSILISNTNDRLQEALELINRAAELDPLSPIIKSNIAQIYGRMGRFAEEESAYLQLLSANPEFSSGMANISWTLYLKDLGQLDDAVVWAQKSNRADPGKINGLVLEYAAWLNLDDDTRAQSIYQQMEELDAESRWLPRAKSWMDLKHGRYAAAKEEAMFLAQGFKNPGAQWSAGIIYARAGDYARARELILRVDPRYADREQWLDTLNEGTDDVCIVGLTLARTGDETLGNELLHYAANYWEETLPRYIKHADRWPSFECYAYLGDVEKSLAALEIALDHGHALRTWLFIASNPELRLIQEDPRFKAMDQRARTELARQRENLAQMEAEAEL